MLKVAFVVNMWYNHKNWRKMTMNKLEERILRFLIEKDNPGQSFAIYFDDVPREYIVQAIKALGEKGYVIGMGTSAILKQEGHYYFDTQERDKYGDYYDAICLIEEKISTAQQLLKSTDTNKMSRFIYSTFMIYSDKIASGIQDGFMTTFALALSDELDDYKRDLQFLIDILQKLLADQKIEANKAQTEMRKIEISPTFNNTNNVSNAISLSVAIENIENCHELSIDEKEQLNKILLEIETLKKKRDKKSLWEKVKAAIGWIIEKGVDVGIAALPYIIQAIQ